MKKKKEEKFKESTFVELWDSQRANVPKDEANYLIKYARGLEARLKTIHEEKIQLQEEKSRLEEELHLIKTGSNLQKIIDKMDPLLLRHLKFNIEKKLGEK